MDCFESLKSRGVKNILFLSVDDNKNMERTAKIAFPEIVFVDSLTDIVLKFFKYTPEKDELVKSGVGIFKKIPTPVLTNSTSSKKEMHFSIDIYI